MSAELAARANRAAQEYRAAYPWISRPMPPTLDENASLATLREWCAWNDPNGDWRHLASGIRSDAWDAIGGMLNAM